MIGDGEYRERLVRRMRLRVSLTWAIRSLCLSGITACAGTVGGWGIQHHHTNIIVLGAVIAVLAFAVMLLNWRLND